jgi:hypothetical protein
VADRENAAMDPMQPTPLEPVVDRTAADAEIDELRPRHDTMLPCREPRDRHIRTSVTFAPYDGAIVNLDRHAPMVAWPALRISTR